MDKAKKRSAAIELHCRADFIFHSRGRNKKSRPIKVLSECMCDVQRPDWDSRWNEWSSGQNPYLNLFLCEEHARKLSLVE